MAVMALDFYARELKMSTLVTLVVPDSVRIGGIPVSERKCLWLLHGLSDDATACLRLSRVELFAQETGVVVVMPSAGRSMYCDGVLGQNWFTHIAGELPEYLNLVTGLSLRREDRYIAGISMGGMGAARIALTFPERYAGLALFSGLLDLSMMLPRLTDSDREEFPFLTGEADRIGTSPLNPVNLLDAEKHRSLPILVRCGRQDDLFPMSAAFYEKAKGIGLRVQGIFEDGSHEWRLWDRFLDEYIHAIAEE